MASAKKHAPPIANQGSHKTRLQCVSSGPALCRIPPRSLTGNWVQVAVRADTP